MLLEGEKFSFIMYITTLLEYQYLLVTVLLIFNIHAITKLGRNTT